jgi:ribosomal protein L3 glutamine methyltransferase
MDQAAKTVADFVRLGTRRLDEAGVYFGHGTDNALDEAACLVFDGLGLAHEDAEKLADIELDQKQREKVLALFERRVVERKPAAYLTGKAWFCGLPFKVDERVLVPRSPIAELIEGGFQPWVVPEQVGSLLDLCTGSGCIAIASALALPDAKVTGSDLSTDAIELARENAAFHGLSERVEFVHSDLFAGLEGRSYDIIVSNPPYVAEQEVRSLPAEYGHEPGMGLAAGSSGLDVVDRILAEVAAMLTPAGALFVEVGASRVQLEEKYPDWPFTWLEFSRGGEGVFLLYREQLCELIGAPD